jgi:molybdopterin-containing oxidoreductase family membrane subunit
VIAIAEVKQILKVSGESYKEKMDKLEEEPVEEFAHAAAH